MDASVTANLRQRSRHSRSGSAWHAPKLERGRRARTENPAPGTQAAWERAAAGHAW